jgi:acetolactate synthase-1/3 small subunit
MERGATVMEKVEKTDYVLSLLVNNKPDVLARIAGTLGGKGYNIDSLCVDITMNPDVSKIILTTRATKIMIGRVVNALNKIVDVVKIENLSEVESIKREMILIRMNLMKETKPELMKAIDSLNCKILTFNTDHCVLQFTGSREDVDKVLAVLKPLGIDDIARTGAAALERKY